jgi:hypothetical protein
MTNPDRHPALTERLAHSRRALLDALAERTESDFHRALRGDYAEESLVHTLARLAIEERGDTSELPDHPLPPQAMHHLAGARYATLSHLATLEDSDAAEAFVAPIVEREQALADYLITHASPRAAKDEQGVATNH